MNRERLKRAASVALTLAVLAGALSSLKVWLKTSGRNDFHVMRLPEGPVMGEGPVTFTLLDETSRPVRALLDGTEVQTHGGPWALSPEGLGPGPHVASWEMQYLGRDARRAVFGLMAGPFASAEEATPCAVRVSIPQALLDDVAAKAGARLHEELVKATKPLRVAKTELSFPVVKGGLDAVVRVTFKDDSRVEARIPFAFKTRKDAAIPEVVQRGAVRAEVTGAVGALASLSGGGLMAAMDSLFKNPKRGLTGAWDAAKQAGNREVARQVQTRLEVILPETNKQLAELLPSTFQTQVFDAGVTLRLSPCRGPAYRPKKGVALRFDLGLKLDAGERPAAASAVPGPVLTVGRPLEPTPKSFGRNLGLALSEDAVNRILDAAWRGGALHRIGNDPAMKRRLNAKLAGAALFRFEGLGVELPPVARLRDGRIDLQLVEAQVGLRHRDGDPLNIAVMATGHVEALATSGGLSLHAKAGRLRASCSVPSDTEGAVVRRPCFPELLDELDRVIAQRGEITKLVPTVGKEGRALEVSGVKVSPGVLEVRAKVEVGF